ncbi:sensor histidine kinase [Plantactinospora siamensis]|uniref:histidine kinase n=1 Tax=Plantactinospora siamensis TaxID=555372 RepID=A0ABV6P1A4_9ACTN
MSATPTPSTDRLLGAAWIAFASGNVLLMWILPGEETVPFHFVWISLALVYGFTMWRVGWMVLALVAVTASTGLILGHHAAVGEIRWEETTEEPLMAAIFIVMVWHVHRRHLLLAELRGVNAAERIRAQRKQLFSRLASHELRTPLTVARGYTELLRAELGDPSSADDFAIVLDELDKAIRISQRMVALVQLDQPPPARPVDLDAELIRILRRWSPTAPRAWSCESAIGAARVNPERLEAALDCLIENAIRFTAPGDRIELLGVRDAEGWRVEVADGGRGMPPAAVRQLLAGDPVQNQPAGLGGGTGLGLLIVREVAASLGGRLSISSRPGRGSRFGIRVPHPAPSLPPPSPRQPAPSLPPPSPRQPAPSLPPPGPRQPAPSLPPPGPRRPAPSPVPLVADRPPAAAKPARPAPASEPGAPQLPDARPPAPSCPSSTPR